MRRRPARRAAAAALACFAAVQAPAVPAGAAGPPGPTTSTTVAPPARAEILVDATTGRMLFGQNEHQPLPPGSLTKMLTALIAVDWLPPGAGVPVSPVAAGAAPDLVGMKPGQVWPLDEVLGSLLVDSANDAAYALAERVSGSLAAFAATMHYAATQMGMADRPVLADPAGLDGREGFRGGNRISAWDLAIAARDLMADPGLAALAGTKRFNFTGPDGIVYSLRNKNIYFLRLYPGAIGVKTGLTDAAGFCVAEEADRAGRAMIAVVLGGQNSYQTAADLLDAGYAVHPAAEPAAAPELPAVTHPEPPAPDRPAAAADPPTPVSVVSTRARSAPAGSGIPPAVPEGAAAGVVIVALLLAGRQLAVGRRNTARRLHSRRRGRRRRRL